jgi:putative transposase
MPRQPRLVVPDVAIHIVQRGNDRQACFRHESDYLLYLVHLRRLAQKAACRLHAYCLMTNHVHLLLTPRDANACASLMRDLGQRYVQYFNRRYARTGTLWEGRFRSCLVGSARYVLACYRYIELNPVRAGLAVHAADYRWSSHAANAHDHADPHLHQHPAYLALGETEAARRASYAGLFEQSLEPTLIESIRNSTHGGFPLAEEAFKSELADSLGRRVQRGRAGRPRKSGSDPDFGANAGGAS